MGQSPMFLSFCLASLLFFGISGGALPVELAGAGNREQLYSTRRFRRIALLVLIPVVLTLGATCLCQATAQAARSRDSLAYQWGTALLPAGAVIYGLLAHWYPVKPRIQLPWKALGLPLGWSHCSGLAYAAVAVLCYYAAKQGTRGYLGLILLIELGISSRLLIPWLSRRTASAWLTADQIDPVPKAAWYAFGMIIPLLLMASSGGELRPMPAAGFALFVTVVCGSLLPKFAPALMPASAWRLAVRYYPAIPKRNDH